MNRFEPIPHAKTATNEVGATLRNSRITLVAFMADTRQLIRQAVWCLAADLSDTLRLRVTRVGICLLVIVVMAGCKKPPVPSGSTDYSSLRVTVIKRVQAGDLKPDEYGVVVLPPNLKSVSADGVIYVSKDSIAGLVIAFKLLQTQNQTEVLLYAEKSIPRDARRIKIGPADLDLHQKIDQHWYQAGSP